MKSIEFPQPTKNSIVICLKCYRRWTACRPQETLLKDLECPKCGKGFVIETGEVLNAKKKD